MKKAIISLALMATTILLNAKMPAILSQAYSPEMTQWVDSVFNKLTPQERIGQIINKMFEADDIEAAKAAVDEAAILYDVQDYKTVNYQSGFKTNQRVMPKSTSQKAAEITQKSKEARGGKWGFSIHKK